MAAPIPQRRKLRPEEASSFPQGHPATKQHSPKSRPGLPLKASHSGISLTAASFPAPLGPCWGRRGPSLGLCPSRGPPGPPQQPCCQLRHKEPRLGIGHLRRDGRARGRQRKTTARPPGRQDPLCVGLRLTLHLCRNQAPGAPRTSWGAGRSHGMPTAPAGNTMTTVGAAAPRTARAPHTRFATARTLPASRPPQLSRQTPSRHPLLRRGNRARGTQQGRGGSRVRSKAAPAPSAPGTAVGRPWKPRIRIPRQPAFAPFLPPWLFPGVLPGPSVV